MCGAKSAIALISTAMLLAGCASHHNSSLSRAPATRPVTTVDAKLATADYWLDKPGTSWVESPTYDSLFHACQTVAIDYGFALDRRDYRDGVVTTRPMVSAQMFEPWRRDVQTLPDSALSTTATHRRTIRFEIARQSDGSYELTPKVLVERETILERRITSAMYFRETETPTGRRDVYGTRETDEGIILPPVYWYAVGRDHTLERSLAAEIYNKVHKS